MAVKRIISNEERTKISSLNLKEFKGTDPATLTQEQINELVKKIAQKMGLL